MHKSIKILGAIACLILLAGLYLVFKEGGTLTPNTEESNSSYGTDNDNASLPVGKSSMVPYSNAVLDLSFEYPSDLYIKEKNSEDSNSDLLSLALVKNTKDNIDYFERTGNLTGEGPTMISVEVYSNTDSLSAKDWVKKNPSRVAINTGSTTPIEIGGEEGVAIQTTGLYEGKSYVVVHDKYAYVFAVTWLSEDDQLTRDFDMIINSATFN